MGKTKNKPRNKKKQEITKSEVFEIEDESIYFKTVPHVLEKNIIDLWTVPVIKERDQVSPPTPDYEQVKFERESIEPVPTTYPSLDLFKIPYVRAVGIKSCIELLGRFFNCVSYKTNHLQYWFLDVLTDCLWRLQDDFQLSDNDQKKVLEYFIYFFKIIINTKVNYSRNMFLRMFKETIYLIGDLIEEGCPIIPMPDALLNLTQHIGNDDDDIDRENVCDASSSYVTDSEFDEVTANFGIKLGNVMHTFNLRKHTWPDNFTHDVSATSSFDLKNPFRDESFASPKTLIKREQKESETLIVDTNTIVGTTAISPTYETKHNTVTNNISLQRMPEVSSNNTFHLSIHLLAFSNYVHNVSDFYQPDLGTPPRFLSSELAFARHAEHEIDYFADAVEEDFEYGDNTYQVDSSSSSIWTVGHSGHNGESQASDISKCLYKTNPCIARIHTPFKKKSAKIEEEVIKTDPTKESIASELTKDSSNRDIIETSPSFVSSANRNQTISSFSSLSDSLSSNTINLLIRARRELKLGKHLNAWFDYNLFEQRIQNMWNPHVGWQPEEHSSAGRNSELLSSEISERMTGNNTMIWRELIHVKDYTEESKHADEQRRVNIVIASAIIECIFEFLYDNFHFTLIKLAFQSTPDLISQNVNYKWNNPKIPKSRFSRPLRSKVKSQKIKNEKTPKSKSTKNSKKSSSKSSKKLKNPKKMRKIKKPKQGGKSKNLKKASKGDKLSKSDIDRMKKEKARSEEEQRKAEENKRYIFPLVDATTDDLFNNIFGN